MDVGSDQPGDVEGTAQPIAAVDLQSRFPGEEEPKEETPTGSISKKLTSIWGAIIGGEEEPAKKPVEVEVKQSLSQKITSIWEKWGEEPKPETIRETEFKAESATPASPFVDLSASADDDLNLHPEFFEQPHPEPDPVPYDEPVIVWGTQQIETTTNQPISPWELSTISSQPADLTQQVQPFGGIPTEPAETPAEPSAAAGALEPYKQLYEVALTVGVVLFIIVVLIFGVDYLM